MRKTHTHSKSNQSGNVLFIILIAVVLFAALSYAVTSSSRSGGGDVSQEKREMAITEMLQYAVSIRTAVQRLTLSGQCDEFSIRFWHASRTNAGASQHYGDGSNTQCQVFHPDGGGIAYRERPKELQEDIGVDEIMILNDRIVDVGTDTLRTGSDLMMAVNVPREACLAINEQMSIENTSGEPPAMTSPAMTNYVSPGSQVYTFPSSAFDGYHQQIFYLGQSSTRAQEIAGFHEGCFSLDSGSDIYYVMYAVILPR